MPGVAPVNRPAKRIGRLGRNKAFTPIPAQPAAPPPPAQKQQQKCCDEPQHETHDGVLLCVNCGTQIAEQNIVSEVTFGETSTGAAQVQGGYVGENSRYAKTLGGQASRRVGGQYQSREETEQNGRSELRQLATQLRIPTHIEEVAFNLWKLAANHNFIQGRRTNEVAGACLYAACRRNENNTVMLMDISEAQSVNVFKLGDIYKELSKTLYLESHTHIKPVMEIEPLLMKYCSRLEFGDRTREVAADAARIIRRMKRDWMVTGRHPAGLCGACIILAARMNNFRRTVREVVYIVKVSDLTIASRLLEFKNTRSSTMSVKDFRSKGHRLKYQHDPPSLHAAEKRQALLDRAMKKRLARLEQRASAEISDTSSVASREPAGAPSEAPTGTPTEAPAGTAESIEESAAAPETAAGQASPPSSAAASISTVPAKRKRNSTRTNDTLAQQQDTPPSTAEQTQPEASPSQIPTEGPRRDADGFAIPALPSATTRASATPDPEASATSKKRRKVIKPVIQLTEEDFASESELASDIENILQDPNCVSARNDTEREKLEQLSSQTADEQRALAAQLTASRMASQGRSHSIEMDSEIISPDEFADDPEVANALLDEEAVKVKETIWLRDNEDWLRAQQAKHLRQELEKAEGRAEKRKKKRKRSRMGDGTVLTEGGTPVQSPADAAQRMLEKRGAKGYSKNIDYAALNRVFGGEVGPSEREKKRMSRSGKSSVASSRAGSEAPSEASSVASSRRSSVSGESRKPVIGDGSWVMEGEDDVSKGKVTGRREEKKALERARRSSTAGSETPEPEARSKSGSAGSGGKKSITPSPAPEEAAEGKTLSGSPEAITTTQPGQQGDKQDQAIAIEDNDEEEDEDEDEDEEEEEEEFEAAESWVGDVAEDDYGDDDDIDYDRMEADLDGNIDNYGR
ncbi:transcription factor-like protein 10 [Elsinoe australis]|uniref:B-related factor 1 n=1 Tax=Elsinoe australis TaxID=40998 RepID=A0A4U7B348_9PEZI|nr:transcription factor-like protein 10 [Elsinoe australis]